MNIEATIQGISFIIGGKIRRGYRFPFGGWLEVKHRYFGKLGLFFFQKSGQNRIFITPPLLKYNSGWCSAVEDFVITGIFFNEKILSFRLIHEDKTRMAFIEFSSGGNFIVTDESGKILWVDNRTSRFSSGKSYIIPDDMIEFQFDREKLKQIELDKILSENSQEFEQIMDEYIAGEVRKVLKKEITRTKRTIEAVNQDSEKLGDPDEIRHRADIIMANLHSIKSRADSAEIIDPYTGETTMVELNPLISPAKFADKLYAKARKAERGKIQIQRRLEELECKLAELMNLEEKEDFRAIAETLEINTSSLLGIPADIKKRKQSNDYGSGVKRYKSSDGFEILVGRSADANNRLTFHIAAKDDIWLHAENLKGSHVVIKLKGKNDAPRRTIEEAASLAAFYSDGKHASLVPVIFTRRRYVHPTKGKPGLVRLDRGETIFIEPKNKI